MAPALGGAVCGRETLGGTEARCGGGGGVAGGRGTTLGRAARVEAGAVGAVPETGDETGDDAAAGVGIGVVLASAERGGADVTGDDGAGADSGLEAEAAT